MKKNLINLFMLFLLAIFSGCTSSSYLDTDAFLDDRDHDGDRRISKEEHAEAFNSMDVNGDGQLDEGELQRGHSGGGRR